MTKIRVAAVALLVIGVLASAHTWGQSTRPSGESDKKASSAKAPGFELKDLDGKVHKLSDYKDKIVVLEWTEPGCPYVKRHYKNKNMQNLAKKWGDKVVWLAVWSGDKRPVKDMKAFRDEYGVQHPILLDRDGKVGKSYMARTTPHMFIVKNGVKVYEGALDDDKYDSKEKKHNYVAAAVDALLAGKPVAQANTTPYG